MPDLTLSTAIDAFLSGTPDAGQKTTVKTSLDLQNVDNTADMDKPVSTAVAAAIAAAVTSLLELIGNIDCSTNPNYPAANKGDSYFVSVAGKIGGASGKTVEVGDLIVASANNAGGTEAAVGTLWFILEKSLNGALIASNNLSELTNAATARTNLGLGNVDNTSDANKPISNATQAALEALPAGNAGEVQYKNGNSFAGAANVEIEGGNLKLMSTADPSAPASGLVLYGFDMAGRLLPKIIGPSGIDTALQPAFHSNSIIVISPASGTNAPTIIGGTLTTAATMSLQYTAGSSSRWASMQRKRFQTSTTAGNATGMRLAYSHCHRGNAAGFGGFFFRAQLGIQINLNGGQKFVGLCASTGALAGEPSALVNMIGMGYDSTDADTGNWQLMRNDGSGSATKVDLGSNAARNTSDGYDLVIFNPPNSSTFYVFIRNLNTNTVVLNTSYNTDVPAANTGLSFKAEVRNGAVAAADNLEVARVYIETNY